MADKASQPAEQKLLARDLLVRCSRRYSRASRRVVGALSVKLQATVARIYAVYRCHSTYIVQPAT